MRLTKKTNNNVALGMDAQGRDVVVFGKGIGFHRMPHEVGAGDVVERVFRDVSKGTVDALSTVDADVLLAASDIVDLAGMQLDYKLSPNLPFTLADHIQFAIERGREGIDIDNPLAGEVALVYPSELTVARTGVAMINRRVNGANLPESEAANIALHLVSGELGGMGDSSSMDLVVRSTTIISRAADIVEKDAGVTLDRMPLVIFGFHWSLVPIAIGNMSTMGYDFILGSMIGHSFSLGAVLFAMYLKNKDENFREICLPAMISAFFFGVTEPAIYGVALPNKKAFINACIGSGVGGLIIGISGAVVYISGGLGVFNWLSYITTPAAVALGAPDMGITYMIWAIIASFVAAAVGFAIEFTTYKPEAAK